MWSEYYFRKHFSDTEFSNFHIEFTDKTSGVQLGLFASLSNQLNRKNEKCYFIKTHQNETKSNSIHNNDFVDIREVFVYKYLEISLKGPKVHFFYNEFDRKDLYIASESIENSFDTFQQLINDSEFFQNFKNNSNYSSSFICANILSKLLLLNDLTTNPDNFGFEKETQNLQILDFEIVE